jgi:TolB protein
MSFQILLLTALLEAFAAFGRGSTEEPQIVIRPSAQEMVLAVADIQPLRPQQAAQLGATLRTLNEVLWEDLKFSGFFTLAGKSFYPPQAIARAEDVNHDAWNTLPFKASFLSFGTLEQNGSALTANLRVYDMREKTEIFGKRFDDLSGEEVRSIAHKWADDVVYRLTAGASRGIASTKIAYTSRRGAAKEIYVMDYDGNDQRAFTRNGAMNLFPKWAADNSKLAFVSNRTGKWQIDIYSYLNGSRLPFPIFEPTVSTPAISPDGERMVFMMGSNIWVSRLDGAGRRNITNSSRLNFSPTWSPAGAQIAFVSDRDGATQIYLCDADGANLRRIPKEGGETDGPAWSPDGRWIAFHWKPRMAENFDIYIVEVSTGQIRQLTANAGSNESPSWAPDGRHIAFQSDRSGSNQIFIMLVDTNYPELRMVTNQGVNTSPSWGGYPR